MCSHFYISFRVDFWFDTLTIQIFQLDCLVSSRLVSSRLVVFTLFRSHLHSSNDRCATSYIDLVFLHLTSHDRPWCTMVKHVDLRYVRTLNSLNLPCKRYSGDAMLLILDWDDTLFPTSYLAYRRISTPSQASERLRGVIASVERRAIRLVRCSAVDKVGIVTTASESWVRDCLRRWMPRLRCTLKCRRVQIISASDQYNEGDGFDRKYRAFRQIHDNEDDVVIVGDGPYEKWAAKAMRNVASNVSFLGFVNAPTPEQLARQIDFAHHCLGPLKCRYEAADLQCAFDSADDHKQCG